MAAYEKLIFFRQLSEIRKLVYDLTEPFSRSHPKVVGQARDAARSAKQNVIEGYQKDSLGSFIQHVKISRGSLGELSGDIKDFIEDNLIPEKQGIALVDLIRRTDFLIGRYIDSLNKMKHNGTWKSRFT